MDALILSCGTGGGHNSAARAVLEEMERRGHRAVMLNPYTLKSGQLAEDIDKVYITIARDAPRAFGTVYKLGDLYRRLPFRSPVYFANRRMNEVLRQYLEEHHFDVIVMTHVFPAEILTNMKRHGMEVPKTIFVATDYVCTPFTEETECDAYIIPARDLADDFVGRGIPREKIYPYGIPTKRDFAVREFRPDIKRRLGLDADKQHILITGGSMGGGKIEKAINKLQNYFAGRDSVELIVVCGSNKGLYEKLSAQTGGGMKVIGYTDDMASYIKASDLFITKPGGLSSTEAAVSGVPILHTQPIPGCESFNANYFSTRGMSISGDITDDMLRRIDIILTDSRVRSEMIMSQKRYIDPMAASRICALAELMAHRG